MILLYLHICGAQDGSQHAVLLTELLCGRALYDRAVLRKEPYMILWYLHMCGAQDRSQRAVLLTELLCGPS